MITDEKDLVFDTFYWVTGVESGERAIAYVTKWYGETVFYVTGSSERWGMENFTHIHPVPTDMNYQCAVCGEDSDGPYYCPEHKY